MPKAIESRNATARTSTAVAKLGRQYVYYIMDCVQDNLEIMPITRFYTLMRDAGELPRSRVFDKYISSDKKTEE